MKAIITILLAFLSIQLIGQVPIYDKVVTHQQQRMVVTSWSKNRFDPKAKRVLGVPTNPLWYATWAWHPDYHKKDRRPLTPTGPQTTRIAMAMAMHNSTTQYEEEQAAIRDQSLKEMLRISGDLSSGDPLYILYYKKELEPLEEENKDQAFTGLTIEESSYMIKNGSVDWFNLKYQELQESYEVARTADMERGQRMLMYHRIMLDMEKLYSNWEYKKRVSKMVIDIAKRTNDMKATNQVFNPTKGYKELIAEIMANTKTLTK